MLAFLYSEITTKSNFYDIQTNFVTEDNMSGLIHLSGTKNWLTKLRTLMCLNERAYTSYKNCSPTEILNKL